MRSASFVNGKSVISVCNIEKRKKPVLMISDGRTKERVLASFISEDEAELFVDYMLESIIAGRREV